MGMTMRFNNGRTYPSLACDKCGQKIDDYSRAVVLFNHPVDMRSDVQVIVHTGTCAVSSLPLSERLDLYLTRMLWNTQFGERVVKDKKRYLFIEVPENELE